MIIVNDPVETYLGNGTVATYTFNFKVRSAADILIIVYNTLDNSLVFQERGNVLSNVQSVSYDVNNGGGSITLPANLVADRKLLIVLAADTPTQTFKFRDQSEFDLRQFEHSLDNLMIFVQRLNDKVNRAFRLSDKASYVSGLNMQIDSLPVAQGIPIFDPTGAFVEFKTPAEIAAAGGSFDDTAYGLTGYSARFSEAFATANLLASLQQIVDLSYLAPTISLAGTGSGTIREKGASLASAPLSAAITKRSDPIAQVVFKRGVTTIDTQVSGGAIPGGGTSTYTDSTGWTDTISFTAEVTDDGSTGGPTTVTSNTVTYTFVYPYYSDNGAVGLTAAAVGGLTKSVIASTATVNKTFTAAGGEVFYFAYLASYGALTSILDVNGFETISDWTLRTENITGLDATAQSYRIYEFNNPVVAGSYFYSFRR
jgi:hypothetical protein